MALTPGLDPDYPAMRYSAQGSVLVRSKAEEDALGPGWFDSPKKVGTVDPPTPKPKRGKKETH